MIDPTAIFIVAIVFGTPLSAFIAYLRHRRSVLALSVQELEAKVRLLEAQQAVPSWVDPKDPASLVAWRQARAELEGQEGKRIEERRMEGRRIGERLG